MKNHYYWIDYAKTIGLLLMILGHGNMVNDEFCHYIYSFHMPLFFIISGLLTRTPNGGGKNYHKYPKKLHGFNGTIFLYEHILLTVFLFVEYCQGELDFNVLKSHIWAILLGVGYNVNSIKPVCTAMWFFLCSFYNKTII